MIKITMPVAVIGALLLAHSPAIAAKLEPFAFSSKPAKKKGGVDCRRIAGQMQIRLFELRGDGAKKTPSVASQVLKQAAAPLVGGGTRGTDAAADVNADLVQLKANNELLKSQNCPHYDIEAELAKPSNGPAPRLIRPSKPN
ncbi:MAG: hypothetical protein JNM89_06070 [Hyphomicrobiaceae bacterium]|nr:hypothetical protein [Hyphomicrobiaceae bacterium]